MKGAVNADHMFLADTLGRISTISLNWHQSELYHLRMFLHCKAGATSLEDIRTIGDEVCDSFQAACVKLGLVEDDTKLSHGGGSKNQIGT